MSRKDLYQKNKLPKLDELRAIRPLEKTVCSDWIWIEIDETQSRVTDRGLDKKRRMKMRIPKRELEAARIKYAKKNLKLL